MPSLPIYKAKPSENSQLPISRSHKLLTLNKSLPRPERSFREALKPSFNTTSRKQISVRSHEKLQRCMSPMDPKDAALALKHKLSEFELRELYQYPKIYYVGLIAPHNKPNHHWDDEKGDYKLVKAAHIAYRFEIIQILGAGSFGQVVKVFDHKLKEMVALKILRNKEKLHTQAYIELKIMQTITRLSIDDQSCLIQLKDSFFYRNHICFVMELLHTDLYEVLRVNRFKGFPLPLIKKFALQLLKALKVTEEMGVIHCDIKPENVLLKSSEGAAIKLIDFGTSCFINERTYTYIQSRFYRAPEIILGILYNTKIDIWSLGCMLAEFFIGKPLFPGKNEVEQLKYIMALKGLPPVSMLLTARRAKLFFDYKGTPLIYEAEDEQMPGTRQLAEVLKDADPLFVDFIDKCLCLCSKKRASAAELMIHPWVLSD